MMLNWQLVKEPETQMSRVSQNTNNGSDPSWLRRTTGNLTTANLLPGRQWKRKKKVRSRVNVRARGLTSQVARQAENSGTVNQG